jgi:hypothetical protein
MPWFITSLISNETITRRAEKHGIRNEPRSRTFGFANSYNEAFDWIQKNMGNMEECLYEYLVVEYMEAGIHPWVHCEHWFRWCTLTRSWRPIDEKPKEFVGITNWALG